MGLRTKEEYFRGIESHPREIYIAGERVDDPFKHPITRSVLNSIGATFDLALKKEYDGILTAIGLDNEKINRFLHIESSKEDLLLRIEAMRIVNRFIGDCNYRCAGHDALNALYATTFEIDREFNTNYHERLKSYLKMVQHNDLVIAGAMTDVKGDRSKGPSEQDEKDTYVHIVEERRDGIVVSGVKMHISGAMMSDELVVIPTRALKEGEEEYAVAFSIPSHTDGIYYISSWNSMDVLHKVANELGVKLDVPSIYGHRITNIILFDNVFIPKERVFMSGEVKYTGNLVKYFIAHHRGGGAGCKAAFGEVIIGATALMAKANGVLESRVIREKLTEMKYHAEASYAPGVAAAIKGWAHESGEYIPDIMLANVAKLEAVNHMKELISLAGDIGGGIVVNMPSGKDLDNLKFGDKLKAVLRADSEYTAEDRLKIARFLQNWVAGIHLVGLIQGGGPPATCYIFIDRLLKEEVPKLIKNVEDITGIRK